MLELALIPIGCLMAGERLRVPTGGLHVKDKKSASIIPRKGRQMKWHAPT